MGDRMTPILLISIHSRLSGLNGLSEFSLDKGRGYMEIESRLQMMRVALSHNWLARLRI